MQRGEIWFAATPGGDRPVLVLTRDPVAGRIGAVVVAALTRTERGLVSELKLRRERDGVPACRLAPPCHPACCAAHGRGMPRAPRRSELLTPTLLQRR